MMRVSVAIVRALTIGAGTSSLQPSPPLHGGYGVADGGPWRPEVAPRLPPWARGRARFSPSTNKARRPPQAPGRRQRSSQLIDP